MTTNQENDSRSVDESDWNTQYSHIRDIAERLLDTHSQKNPMRTGALVESISRELGDIELDDHIYSYIRHASNDVDTRIASQRGRNGGYFLVREKANSQSGEALPPRSLERDQKALEKHLWPLVAYWLKHEKELRYTSHQVANLKSGGTWSNPDVISIDPIDDLVFFDVEILTCEVKPSISQWRYYIFEAISHKRFSERSYFVFRIKPDKGGELSEVLLYAEKYGIGIATIEMDDDEYDELRGWSDMSSERKLDLMNRVVENIPSPFDPVSIRNKVALLRRIGISNRKDIYSFGNNENK